MKKYISPIMEIEEFNVPEFITTSFTEEPDNPNTEF